MCTGGCGRTDSLACFASSRAYYPCAPDSVITDTDLTVRFKVRPFLTHMVLTLLCAHRIVLQRVFHRVQVTAFHPISELFGAQVGSSTLALDGESGAAQQADTRNIIHRAPRITLDSLQRTTDPIYGPMIVPPQPWSAPDAGAYCRRVNTCDSCCTVLLTARTCSPAAHVLACIQSGRPDECCRLTV